MIHTVIAQERRKAPRQLAIEMNNDLRTQTGTDKDGMPAFSVTPRPAQLHSMGEAVPEKWAVAHKGVPLPGYFSNKEDAIAALNDKGNENYTPFNWTDLSVVYLSGLASEQIIYAAEWDGSSPWVTVHKGNIADLKMMYAGWPCVTQAEWEAANPPVING